MIAPLDLARCQSVRRRI